MKDLIEIRIKQEVDALREKIKSKASDLKPQKEREAILENDLDTYLSYTWKPKKIWFPKWWPKAFDVNLWRDTPDNRIKALIKAAALITLEIERMEKLSMRQVYEIWVESNIPGELPTYIGQSIGSSFDEAVKLFMETVGVRHNISPESPRSYSSKAEWEARRSNWNIDGKRLFPTDREALSNSKTNFFKIVSP